MATAKARISDAEIRRQTVAARVAQKAERKAGRVAVAARYDATDRRIVVEMSNGVVLSIPVRTMPELKRATAGELATVTVDELGYGLHWEALDVDVSVLGLLSELIGQRTMFAAVARRGGSTKSEAKAAAARANGAKGGRPRKMPTR